MSEKYSESFKFDTHAAVKDLISSGFKEEQAEKIIRVVVDAKGMDFSSLATKKQIDKVHSELNSKIDTLDGKINKVHGELNSKIDKVHGELNVKIDKVYHGLDAKIDKLEYKVESTINKAKSDLLMWIIPFMLGVLVAILGILVRLLSMAPS